MLLAATNQKWGRRYHKIRHCQQATPLIFEGRTPRNQHQRGVVSALPRANARLSVFSKNTNESPCVFLNQRPVPQRWCAKFWDCLVPNDGSFFRFDCHPHFYDIWTCVLDMDLYQAPAHNFFAPRSTAALIRLQVSLIYERASRFENSCDNANHFGDRDTFLSLHAMNDS